MKCPKKALAFIGAVALLFQGGCSAPDQENRENWETVIECQYEDMGISPNQQFLIAKKGGLYGAYVKNGDSYELKIPFQYEKILCNIYSDDSLFCYYPETGLLDIYGKDGAKLQNRPFSSMENYTRRLAEGGYTVSYDEKEQGYISKEGEWILHPVYSQIEFLIQYQKLQNKLEDMDPDSQWNPSDIVDSIPEVTPEEKAAFPKPTYEYAYYSGTKGKIVEVKSTFTWYDTTYTIVEYYREGSDYGVFAGFADSEKLSPGDIALWVADSLEVEEHFPE